MAEKTIHKTGVNSYAIVSLTTGILSLLVPLVGLILGIIGVITSRIARREIQKTNEGGSGLALSGLICSIVGIVLQLFMVVGVVAPIVS